MEAVSVHRRRCLVVLVCALLSIACADPRAPRPEEQPVEPPAFTPPNPTRPGATTEPTPDPTVATEPTPDPTVATAPEPRSWGVVLIDPLIEDALNVREWPGVDGPILGTLHRTQIKVFPTGRVSSVDGRPWYEVTAGEITGWVHGRYITETWADEEVTAVWDWETALDRFVEALLRAGDLADAVSWRGFYAVDGGGGLHWWKPDQLPTMFDDKTPIATWDFGARLHRAGNGVRPSAAELIAVPFLAHYHDVETEFVVGGGVIGGRSEVSTAFANFAHVAMYSRGDDPEPNAADWSTWFIFLERDGPLPRVVGVQHEVWRSALTRGY